MERPGATLKHELYRFFYFLLRYLVVSFALFLSVIGCLYGISNIINLEATNLLCDQHTASEVHAHSVKYRLAGGDPNSCWYINRAKLNANAIESLDLDIYEATFDKLTGWDIFFCAIFFLVSLFLSYIGLYYGYYTIYDTYYAIKFYNNTKQTQNKNPRLEAVIQLWQRKQSVQNLELRDNESNTIDKNVNVNGNINNREMKKTDEIEIVESDHDQSITTRTRSAQSRKSTIEARREHDKITNKKYWCVCMCLVMMTICQQCEKMGCKKCQDGWNKIAPKIGEYFRTVFDIVRDFKKSYYYNDSMLKILNALIVESIEIIIQFYVLHLYSGIDISVGIFDNDATESHYETLATQPYKIEIYAMIVGLNGILTGCLWIAYVVFHSRLYGALFIALLYCVDTIFEICYVLFPLIYMTSGDSIFDLETLGLLKQQNPFYSIQSLMALGLFANKSHTLIKHLDAANIEYRLQQSAFKIRNNMFEIHEPWITNIHWES